MSLIYYNRRTSTKELLQELIDYFESHKRNKKQTIKHIVKTKNVTEGTATKWLNKYLEEGPAILEAKHPRKPISEEKRKSLGHRYLYEETAAQMRRVLEVLKQDPNISCTEGAFMLGMQEQRFWNYKKRLQNPDKFTREMKIQLGLLPGPLPPRRKRGRQRKSDPNPETDDNIGTEDHEPEVEADDDIQELSMTTDVEEEDSSSNDNNSDSDYSEDELERRRQRFREKQDEDWCPWESDYQKQKYAQEALSTTSSQVPSKYCLLCCVCLEERKPPEEFSKSTRRRGRRQAQVPVPLVTIDDEDELEQNLNVICALRNIFGLDSKDLISFMNASNGDDPRKWYHLCGDCKGMMKEAVSIQRQVLQLSRNLEECKRKIEKKMKKALRSAQPSNILDDLDVTSLIRKSIPGRRKKDVSCQTSLIMRDEVIMVPVIKTEVDDDHNDNQDHIIQDDEDFNDVNRIDLNMETEHENTGDIDSQLPEPSNVTVSSNDDAGMIGVKPKEVICELCGETVRQFRLALHTLRNHGITMEGYEAFKCPKEGCNFMTVQKTHLKHHLNIRHMSYEDRKHVCPTCGKRFATNSRLKLHSEVHENVQTRPYVCELCGSSFKAERNLTTHRRLTHEKRPFPYMQKGKGAKKKPKPSSTSTSTTSCTSFSEVKHDDDVTVPTTATAAMPMSMAQNNHSIVDTALISSQVDERPVANYYSDLKMCFDSAQF